MDAASLATVTNARQAVHRVLHGADDRLVAVVGPCSIHDSARRWNTRRSFAMPPPPRERPLHRDARVLREAAHDGRLEGLHQRPAPGRQLRHQRGPAARAQAPPRDQPHGPALRHRVPRPALAAIHLGPHRVGRHRRAHHREPDASPARLGPVVPGGLQERHRRLDQGGRGRAARGRRAARLHGHDEDGPGRDLRDRRQRGLPRDPARRQGAQLRRGERGRGGAKELAEAGLAPHLMVDFSHANASKQYEKQMEVGANVARSSPPETSASWA